jgi:Fe-S cluster biogenesis protein NfuA
MVAFRKDVDLQFDGECKTCGSIARRLDDFLRRGSSTLVTWAVDVAENVDVGT